MYTAKLALFDHLTTPTTSNPLFRLELTISGTGCQWQDGSGDVKTIVEQTGSTEDPFSIVVAVGKGGASDPAASMADHIWCMVRSPQSGVVVDIGSRDVTKVGTSCCECY
jgi:hypothetical protein